MTHPNPLEARAKANAEATADNPRIITDAERRAQCLALETQLDQCGQLALSLIDMKQAKIDKWTVRSNRFESILWMAVHRPEAFLEFVEGADIDDTFAGALCDRDIAKLDNWMQNLIEAAAERSQARDAR